MANPIEAFTKIEQRDCEDKLRKERSSLRTGRK